MIDSYYGNIYEELERKSSECEKLKQKLQTVNEALEKINKNYSCPYMECDKCSITCSMHEIKQILERIKE